MNQPIQPGHSALRKKGLGHQRLVVDDDEPVGTSSQQCKIAQASGWREGGRGHSAFQIKIFKKMNEGTQRTVAEWVARTPSHHPEACAKYERRPPPTRSMPCSMMPVAICLSRKWRGRHKTTSPAKPLGRGSLPVCVSAPATVTCR